MDFSITFNGFYYYLSWISLLPLSLQSLDFTGFATLRNQVSNQVSNQAINQGGLMDGFLLKLSTVLKPT